MQIDMAMSPVGILITSTVILMMLALVTAQAMVYTFSYEMCMNTFNDVPFIGGFLKNLCVPMGGIK
ncbi:MAG: hypothetical protein ABEK17_04690 [Candidatus Aenigmatarchaeota archaeon]